jgi:EAL and modified HD-GYP domain-containing signal transduction protein
MTVRAAEASLDGIVYLARQPIFDRAGKVVGYELLQRTADTSTAPLIDDDDQTTMLVTAKALVDFGFENLVGRELAFVNLSAGHFIEGHYRPFPPSQTVLEVLERVPVTPALFEALRLAREAGYRIALDDFQGQQQLASLIPLVDIVKVDVLGLTTARVVTLVNQVRAANPKASLLGEKVETWDQHTVLRDLGVDLFQGYYFARPAVLTTPQVPAHALVLMKLASMLEARDIDLGLVARLVSQEPRISYRLLRMVNSAAVGLAQRVDSIPRATTLLGSQQVRRIVLLFTVASVSGDNDEIVKTAAIRGFMCEALAPRFKLDPVVAFTVGLLSLVDTAFGMSMDELMVQLPLSDVVKAALLRREGGLGRLLTDVVDYERGRARLPKLEAAAFVAAFTRAVAATEELSPAFRRAGGRARSH